MSPPQQTKTDTEPNSTALLLSALSENYAARATFTSKTHPDTLALWTLYTHVHKLWAEELCSMLHCASHRQDAGKSEVRKALTDFACKPLAVTTISSAFITRFLNSTALGDAYVTLIIDEAQALFRSTKADKAALEQILNAGSDPGLSVAMADPASPTEFVIRKMYTPRALFGIGTDILPAATDSRSIRIVMKTQTTEQFYDRLQRKNDDKSKSVDRVSPIKRAIEKWVDEESENVDPFFSENGEISLGDRLMANREYYVWLPLFCIAKLAGEEWLRRCTNAARELTSPPDPSTPDDFSRGVKDAMRDGRIRGVSFNGETIPPLPTDPYFETSNRDLGFYNKGGIPVSIKFAEDRREATMRVRSADWVSFVKAVSNGESKPLTMKQELHAQGYITKNGNNFDHNTPFYAKSAETQRGRKHDNAESSGRVYVIDISRWFWHEGE